MVVAAVTAAATEVVVVVAMAVIVMIAVVATASEAVVAASAESESLPGEVMVTRLFRSSTSRSQHLAVSSTKHFTDFLQPQRL